MNRYQPSTPRALIGLAAFALSTLTIMATVMLPAKIGSANSSSPVVSARGTATPRADAGDYRMRVEVIGVREADASRAESKASTAADWQG